MGAISRSRSSSHSAGCPYGATSTNSQQPAPHPLASEALKHIAAIYAIENEIRGRSAEKRRLVRQQKTRPLVDPFETWLHAKLTLISQKIKLAEAIRYARRVGKG